MAPLIQANLRSVDARRAVTDYLAGSSFISVAAQTFVQINVPIVLPASSFTTPNGLQEMLDSFEFNIIPTDGVASVPWHVGGFIQDASGCFSFRLYNDAAQGTGKYLVSVNKVR